MTAGVCPTCGLPGIPYLYGYPSGKGMDLANAGLVVLGGCEVWPGQPDFTCPRGHEWTGPTAALPDDAERRYRARLEAAIEEHGDDHPETDAVRHALTLVLAAAGRTDDAAAAFAPIRARREARRKEWLRQDPR